MKQPSALLLGLAIITLTGALAVSSQSQNPVQLRQPPQTCPRGVAPGSLAATACNEFAAWIKTGNTTEIKWETSVEEPVLQMNQNLTVRYLATVTVKSLGRIQGDRELVFLFRADKVDSADSRRPFPEGYGSILVPKNAASNIEILFNEQVSVQPGDYVFWLAIYDGATKRHSIRQHRVHISTIPDDPLPLLQIPNLSGKISLPVSNRRPLTVDLISLNQNQPALEMLAQMKLADGSLSVTVLDIENQRVMFEQRDVRKFDMQSIYRARGTNGGAIDVNALLTRKEQTAFLRNYLRYRLEASSTRPRMVILLSGPLVFPRGNDLAPLVLEQECQCRIIHLLYGQYIRNSPYDDIQKLLKLLPIERFEYVTSLDLRKALAGIIQELEEQ